MASPAEEALPALPPIKTTPLPPPPSAASASSSPAPASSSARDSAKEAEVEEPSTPTSEESRLLPRAECPPAPARIRRHGCWRRKLALPPSPARVYVAVPRDLSTVFRPLSPKKRIRVS